MNTEEENIDSEQTEELLKVRTNNFELDEELFESEPQVKVGSIFYPISKIDYSIRERMTDEEEVNYWNSYNSFFNNIQQVFKNNL